MIETSDTANTDSQQEQCKRCEERKETFKKDYRWGRVCIDCHKELFNRYGPYTEQRRERSRRKVRGDGQLVGSPPPEEL